MVDVIKWPPVGITAMEWTQIAPVAEQQSLITGARFPTASARKRRLATVTASALGAGRNGAGYVENLKMLLDGGINLVRFDLGYVNWWMDRFPTEVIGNKTRLALMSSPVSWKTGTDPDVDWTSGGNAVSWFTGRDIRGTAGTSGGYPILTITNAPPSRLVARPGDFLTLYSPIDSITGTSARVMTEARSDSSGGATIRLMSALSGTGRVNIGTADQGVFRVRNQPRAVQPLRGDWYYTFELEEAFADEVPGGFVEKNPW